MSRMRIRHLTAAAVVAVLTGFLLAPAAVADHGEGHNGETMELSKSDGIADGETVSVTLSSWLPGKTATIVTCFNYPAVGPADCELSNYGMHTVTISDDGTATKDYPVAVVPGRCDVDNSCFVVAGDGFGPDANYAAQAITFVAGAPPEPEPAVEDEEPMPVAEQPDDAADDTAAVAAPDSDDDGDFATGPVTEPTLPAELDQPAPDDAADDTTDDSAAAPDSGDDGDSATGPVTEPTSEEPSEADDGSEMAAPAAGDDDGSSVWVWLLPVIIVVVVVAGIGLWFFRRRSGSAAA
ncbi:hypothetical protein [Candidatus Poriferisocius sp.]|uniref:hypothetical protein n=1 Tax=Candidatus Poriferisocius sp. TaxID=3101276 RepID=UPI003B59C73F